MEHAWGSALGYRTREPRVKLGTVKLLFDDVAAAEQQ